MVIAVEKHPFIFSGEWKWKIRRHLVFWIFWWVFQAVLYSFVAAGRGPIYWLRLQSSFVESLIYLAPHIFLSYSLIYFVIPRFLLKGKYRSTAVWVLVLFVISAGLSVLLSVTAIEWVRHGIMQDEDFFHRNPDPVIRVFLSLMAGFRGAITVGGMAASIKLMKHWYMKEQRNLQLQKENVEAQLQLLKAQVHPHFLFNTLNNIYSHTQQTSAAASQLVMGLSDMLRYMLYETGQSLVPLQKELKMIEDYISLESIRYDNKLDVHIEINGNAEELFIAPLLLIPFVENCFKHGTSHIIEHPWISLHIELKAHILQMKLLNGKPEKNLSTVPENGIGIENVQKRLRLLYPGTHHLDTINEPEVFIVNLKLELYKKETGPVNIVPKPERQVYA